MDELNKKKLITSLVACALVLAVVAVAERFPAVSHLLETSSAYTDAVTQILPSAEKTRAGVGATTTVSKKSEKVDINSVSASELQTLKGIGPFKAGAIVDYREKSGPFYSIEDIMKVKGIGKETFDSIAEYITIGSVSSSTKAPVPAKSSALNVQTSTTSSSQEISAQVRMPTAQTGIKIMGVMAGIKGNALYELIELYNPNAESVDLTGWSVKKKSSTGSVSMLVASSRLASKVIRPDTYFLLANDGGYTGTPVADVMWPPSYTFARANNALILYNKAGQAVDEVVWSEIPQGKWYARTSPETGDFMVTDPMPHNSSN